MILEFPFSSGSVDTQAPMQLHARMHLLQPMHLSFVKTSPFRMSLIAHLPYTDHPEKPVPAEKAGQVFRLPADRNDIRAPDQEAFRQTINQISILSEISRAGNR
jgi:hypothetical protein